MNTNSKILLFLAITIGLSILSYVPILISGSLYAMGGLFMLTLMWSPGLAALITQRITTHSLRGLGWQPGPARWLGLAYVLPILYGLPVYAFVWLTGLAGLPNPEWLDTLAQQMPTLSQPVRIAVFILISATVMVLISMITALGEEIGWRGFLVPELAKTNSFTRTALISGIIWSVWHMPALFFTDYNRGGTPGWYSTACFAIMVITTSFAYAWLRLKSGSLWPAALLHASHNLFILNILDDVTIASNVSPYLISETGLGLAVAGFVVAYIFWRKRKSLPSPPLANKAG